MNNLPEVTARQLNDLNELLMLQIEIMISTLDNDVAQSNFSHRLDCIRERRGDERSPYEQRQATEKAMGRWTKQIHGRS